MLQKRVSFSQNVNGSNNDSFLKHFSWNITVSESFLGREEWHKKTCTLDLTFLSKTKLSDPGCLLSWSSSFVPPSSFEHQPIELSLSFTSHNRVRGPYTFNLVFLSTSLWYKYSFQQASVKYFGYSSLFKCWKV